MSSLDLNRIKVRLLCTRCRLLRFPQWTVAFQQRCIISYLCVNAGLLRKKHLSASSLGYLSLMPTWVCIAIELRPYSVTHMSYPGFNKFWLNYRMCHHCFQGQSVITISLNLMCKATAMKRIIFSYGGSWLWTNNQQHLFDRDSKSVSMQ